MRANRRNGFSLVELMVVMMVAGLLIWVCVAVMRDFSRQQSAFSHQQKMDREIRWVLDQIRRDLSALPSDPMWDLKTNERGDVFSLGLLRMWHTRDDEELDDGSDLCAVRYSFASIWENERWVRVLRRGQKGHVSVMESLEKGGSDLYEMSSEMNETVAYGLIGIRVRESGETMIGASGKIYPRFVKVTIAVPRLSVMSHLRKKEDWDALSHRVSYEESGSEYVLHQAVIYLGSYDRS